VGFDGIELRASRRRAVRIAIVGEQQLADCEGHGRFLDIHQAIVMKWNGACTGAAVCDSYTESTWEIHTSGRSVQAVFPLEVHLMSLILLLIVVLLLLGTVPAWPYSRSWGYGPSGGLGVILIVLIVLLVMGVL
jgi:hypothetical protein